MLTEAPIASQHLGRPHVAEIRVSPAAATTYATLTPDSEHADGSFFVEWLRDASSGRPGPIFALERLDSGWRYWVLARDGQTQQSGELEPCAGCHAGAPAAPVFGLPKITLESTRKLPRSPQRDAETSKPGRTGL